jgi:hypothetical protein
VVGREASVIARMPVLRRDDQVKPAAVHQRIGRRDHLIPSGTASAPPAGNRFEYQRGSAPSSGHPARFEDEFGLQLVQAHLQPDGITMRILESLDRRMKLWQADRTFAAAPRARLAGP